MADDSEERKEKIRQLLTGFVKIKTEREQKKTSTNEDKIDQQWREIFREATTKKLKDELLQMEDSFVRTVAYKDAVIDTLKKEVEQVEVQNMWATGKHMRSLAKLLAHEKERSDNLRQDYENELAKLWKLYCETKSEIENNFKEAMQWFKDLQFIEKMIFEDFTEKSKIQIICMKTEITEKICKEKEDVTETFDLQISKIWRKFQLALVKYLEDAGTMESIFTSMKAEYQEAMEDFEQDRSTTDELQHSIPQLKAQIEEKKNDHKERIQKILESHDSFYSDATALKARILKIQKNDRTSLKNLIVNSGNAVKELQDMIQKGQKIMKLYENCRKMETGLNDIEIDEPVLSLEDAAEIAETTRFNLPEGLHLDETCQYIGLLEKFWERHSRVHLKNLALKRELDDIMLLNAQLKSDMSKFFKAVAEGKDKNTDPVKIITGRPTVQEAVLLARNFPDSK